MPTVAVLRNKLKILIFWDDHDPPHFHADYQHRKAKVSIETLQVEQSANPRRRIPIRIQQEMLKWAKKHQSELMQAWEIAQDGKKPPRIPYQ